VNKDLLLDAFKQAWYLVGWAKIRETVEWNGMWVTHLIDEHVSTKTESEQFYDVAARKAELENPTHATLSLAFSLSLIHDGLYFPPLSSPPSHTCTALHCTDPRHPSISMPATRSWTGCGKFRKRWSPSPHSGSKNSQDRQRQLQWTQKVSKLPPFGTHHMILTVCQEISYSYPLLVPRWRPRTITDVFVPHGQDLFAGYRNQLMKRLLNQRSASDEMETRGRQVKWGSDPLLHVHSPQVTLWCWALSL
jgi:hypothetical protein